MKIHERRNPDIYVPEPVILKRPSRLGTPDSGTRIIWEAVDRFGKDPLCLTKKTDPATKAGTI